MSAVDLVIFDFDGTLADSARGITACMGAAFASFALAAPSLPDVRVRIGMTLEEAIRQLIRDRRDVDIAAVAHRYRELHVAVAAPETTLFAGVDGTLALLNDAGIRMLVVSQKARKTLVQLLNQLDIARHFELVLGSDEVSAAKPHPSLFDRHIAPRYPDIARDRVLVVGDTDIDLRFAANIGARSCWVEYGYGHAGSCRAQQPTYTIADITALPRVCGVTAP